MNNQHNTMTDERIAAAKAALGDMDDYARMETGVNAMGPRDVLTRFIDDVADLLSAQRSEVLEEAALHIEEMNASAGDSAAYDNREMDRFEEGGMFALTSAATRIRALKTAAPQPSTEAAKLDSDECESCVNGLCVTGSKCVTLGLDSSCKECAGSGTVIDTEGIEWPCYKKCQEASSDKAVVTDDLDALMSRIEWGQFSFDDHGYARECCPCCGSFKDAGHENDCDFVQLAALLQSAAPVMPPQPVKVDACPITRRPFFMEIEHPEQGMIPTYGGPFDSYGIPYLDEDGDLRCEHFDHDRGEWIEGGAPLGYYLTSEQPEDCHLPVWLERYDPAAAPAQTVAKEVEQAEAWVYDISPAPEFIEYVRQNYQGEVVFHDPEWHALRLWNAALRHAKPMMVRSSLSVSAQEGEKK